jgi:hypothetical protein
MTSVVSDETWQAWAEELKELQADGPVTTGYFDEDFKDWTGETGMHLCQEPWVHSGAQYVVRLHQHPPKTPLLHNQTANPS